MVIMKKLGSLFLAGLAALLPLALSIYLIWWLFVRIDGILAPVIQTITGHHLPGLGFLITILLILFIGLMATSLIGNRLMHFWEGLLLKTPLLGRLYSSIKRIVGAVLSPNKTAFRQVVMLEYPRKGLYVLGFITNENFYLMDEENYCVFVPTTPNPTSGFFMVAPRDQVQILDMPVEQAMELIISAGMVNGS